MKNKSESSVGYLYCIYNKMYDVYGENIFKLGNMKNKNIMNSYVTPYVDPIEIKFISNKILDKSIGEKILFDILKEFRFRPNREFFRCDLSIIKKAFDEVESIFKRESLDKLQELYNSMCKEKIINNMISNIDDVSYSETPDISDIETPNGSTPNGSTPNGSTPNGSTPNGSTPNGSTPSGSTPNGSTPDVSYSDRNTDDDVKCDELCHHNQILYDKFKRNNKQLEKKLKIPLTPDIISKWYNKEYILDNALFALGKKHYDDSLDPYFSNIGLKIKYLNDILDVFGFKSLMDFNTVVELTDSLREKMKNSKLIDKANYSYILKVFNKQIQSKDLEGKFEVNKFIKFCNCILNEFGFKIDSNSKQNRVNSIRKWSFMYYIIENLIDIVSIINKY